MYKNLEELKKMNLMGMVDYLNALEDSDSLEFLTWYENDFVNALDEKYIKLNGEPSYTPKNEKHFLNLLEERRKNASKNRVI